MINILIPTCKEYEEINPLIKELEENTPEEHKIIASCQPLCASANRNLCHENAESEIIISMDDDMTGFYKGWLTDLIEPLQAENIATVSARFLQPDGKPAHMMWCGESMDNNIQIVDKFPTACFAYRKKMFDMIKSNKDYPDNIPYDEHFKGSGFEDDDICIIIKKMFPDMRFVVNNKCKLTHKNEMKNQKGTNWELNKKYIIRKYPWHPIVWH